ncbi:DUF484 family protein [Aquisalimonas sp.]|uniref:DUF484 family protein n=1 Tax=unclassified Aquisalimonas TaxID=2644645 RepID=UPI0025C4051B|nr:DUF484 family protein [Aquisalimonas sp.]
MTSQNSAGLDDTLPEEAVSAYLEENPDFFARHPALVTRLRIPHECGDATSLITYQVARLRDENKQLKRRLDDLLQVARDNDRLADQLHRLTLELMDSQDLDGLLQTLKDGLRHQFQSDLVAIALLPTQGEAGGQDVLSPDDQAVFGDFIKAAKPRLGRLDPAQAALLFGDAADRLGSAAIVPISDNHHVSGILAVGSFEPDRFNPSQGTVFLRQLGQLAGRALRPYRTSGTA